MATGTYGFAAEQYTLARQKTRQEDILRNLRNREISVDSDSRDRITSCSDLNMLDTWMDRSVTIPEIADVVPGLKTQVCLRPSSAVSNAPGSAALRGAATTPPVGQGERLGIGVHLPTQVPHAGAGLQALLGQAFGEGLVGVEGRVLAVHVVQSD